MLFFNIRKLHTNWEDFNRMHDVKKDERFLEAMFVRSCDQIIDKVMWKGSLDNMKFLEIFKIELMIQVDRDLWKGFHQSFSFLL